MASGGAFGRYFRSVLHANHSNRQHPSGKANNRPTGETAAWPMPPPYPYLWKQRPGAKKGRFATKHQMLNTIAIVGSWMTLGRPETAPPHCRLGARLSADQWQAIGNMATAVTAWSAHPYVDVSELGRMTDKAESFMNQLECLKGCSDALLSEFGKYRRPPKEHWPSQTRHGTDPGTQVVGRVHTSNMTVTRPLVTDRVGFHGTPTFDPRPYLVPEYLSLFDTPQLHAIDPDALLPRYKSAPRARSSSSSWSSWIQLGDFTCPAGLLLTLLRE